MKIERYVPWAHGVAVVPPVVAGVILVVFFFTRNPLLELLGILFLFVSIVANLAAIGSMLTLLAFHRETLPSGTSRRAVWALLLLLMNYPIAGLCLWGGAAIRSFNKIVISNVSRSALQDLNLVVDYSIKQDSIHLGQLQPQAKLSKLFHAKGDGAVQLHWYGPGGRTFECQAFGYVTHGMGSHSEVKIDNDQKCVVVENTW
ncbi:MAG TPA: hypothetical protein VI895_10325 [Bdellovibrionota bacterium]|nr:hypothetical protein [Bdellovibrionota bacterium]